MYFEDNYQTNTCNIEYILEDITTINNCYLDYNQQNVLNDSEINEIFKHFSENFFKNMKDIDPEMVDMVDENFWNLI